MTTAIDTTEFPLSPHDGSGSSKTKWIVNARTTDVSGDQVIKAKPGGALALYITDLFINCVVDASILLGEEDDAVTYGKFQFLAANPHNVDLHFNHPIKLTTDKALEVDCGAIAITVIVQGFTA